jgi:hypothetical protein
VQIVRRLPVAPAGYLGARRDDAFDFGFELGVEGRGIRRGKVEDPKPAWGTFPGLAALPASPSLSKKWTM